MWFSTGAGHSNAPAAGGANGAMTQSENNSHQQQPTNEPTTGQQQQGPRTTTTNKQPQVQPNPATATTNQAPPSTITTTTTTTTGGGRPEKISFHLKTSIFTRLITIDSDKMALGLVKQLAIAFLNEIYFQQQYPANSYIGDYIRKHFSNTDSLNQLYERIVLKLHHSDEGDSFVPFNSVSDIKQDSFISIEISERRPASSYHHLLSTSTATNIQSSSSCTTPTSFQLKISHDFHPESYFIPTHCASCSTLIKGVYKQGFQCHHCKKNYCPKCKVRAEAVGEGCLALAPTASSSTLSSTGSTSSIATPAAAAAAAAAQSSSTMIGANQFLVPQTQGCPRLSTGEMSDNDNQQDISTSSGSNNSTSGSNGQSNNNNNSDNQKQPAAETNHSNMSKRKSASNLLHFNIANPFKSHHNQQQQQQQQAQQQQHAPKEDKSGPSTLSKSMRGSAGALDPILQQLSKQMRDQHQHHHHNQQQQQPSPISSTTVDVVCQNQNVMQKNNNPSEVQQPPSNNKSSSNLLVVHTSQLSSSHQNLYTINDKQDESTKSNEMSGSSSVHQSPTKNNAIGQLSNSARTSARDLLRSISPTNRDQATGHAFISMDWIQLSGQPVCGVCSKLLETQRQQQQPPSMCKICKLLVHSQCKTLAPADCMNRVAESSRAAAANIEKSPSRSSEKQSLAGDNQNRADNNLKGTISNTSRDNIRLHRLAPSVKHIKRPDLTRPIIEGWLQHKTLSDEQSRRHYWRLDDTDITLYENDTSTRYFKAIALSKITRVISASSLPKQVKEDVLLSDWRFSSEENKADQSKQAKSANNSPARTSEFKVQMEAMFGFEVATGSVYLVQASDASEANRWKGSLEAITTKRTLETQATKTDQDGQQPPETRQQQQQQQLHQLQQNQQDETTTTATKLGTVVDNNLPTNNVITNKQADETMKPPPVKQANVRHHHHHHHHHHTPSSYRGQHKTHGDSNRSRLYNRPRITIELSPMVIIDHLIEGKYLIERDRVKGKGFEELGSGQFGKVYAAISEIRKEDPAKGLWSGVPVAIKEISKTRFDLRQQAKLKNEANILSRLDHPGVIILERVHDLPDKIYIVMEQLEDDMLEMIVSTPEKRLDERVTKFLTYQILEALKYLHAQNIAHCDLKPENVLLVERRSQFPQIKLCDFGFAKIIEENSFRSSLVGTPAYLAPEVVKGERYNRSVDLWSVGVIVYVSLSGEFPFNEGENIHDQISRANFMYPNQPWAKISNQAKNFINSLLRVNSDKRLSASRAQMDDWIQDYQLWCDLCELEMRVNKRWVTDDADYERWTRYARENNFQVPRSASLLHDKLRRSESDDEE